jgi:hypothetical protein
MGYHRQRAAAGRQRVGRRRNSQVPTRYPLSATRGLSGSMSFSYRRLRWSASGALVACALLSAACLSSNSNKATTSPVIATASSAAAGAGSPAGTASPGPGDSGTAVATIVSQAQPGATGVLMTGVIALNGDAPPTGSTLYLGLVTSADDTNPRTCIDAARNPVNDVGQFYAQVACKPKSGDQLLYVLIIGDPGQRNWHRGVIPMPADLTNFRIDAS